MPLYEVLLLRDDEQELRLTDQSLSVGETVALGEERWLVQREDPPERGDAAARFVCIRDDETQ
jgi:hypothetical protein